MMQLRKKWRRCPGLAILGAMDLLESIGVGINAIQGSVTRKKIHQRDAMESLYGGLGAWLRRRWVEHLSALDIRMESWSTVQLEHWP